MAISFKDMKIGAEYTRPELARLWGLRGYEALSRGIVTFADVPIVVLFITEEKQSLSTQYEDAFAEGVLEIDGESRHTNDRRLVDAQSRGDRVHLFHRKRHHTPFSYEGEVTLVDYTLYTDRPSRFRFKTVQPAEGDD